MFDWENAIALDTMQGNRASSCRAGKVSWVFSSCGRNLGYILELQQGRGGEIPALNPSAPLVLMYSTWRGDSGFPPRLKEKREL